MQPTGRRRPVIGVMGAGEPQSLTLHAARRLGQLAAEAGWVVLTGGRPAGVMEAACAGAKSVPGSLTIGILPTGPDEPVSAHVDVAVFTGVGEARNVINVLSSDVVVACGVEGAGTASEVALALKLGRPTVLLAAAPAASAFFRTIASRGMLHEVQAPESVIEFIEQHLGIPRWRAV
ncbi:MAG: cytochrome [Gemmatimonadales bacterium]